jgi:hypothetical protein
LWRTRRRDSLPWWLLSVLNLLAALTNWLITPTPTDLDVTFQEHLHAIGKLERLQRIVKDQCGATVAGLGGLLPATEQFLLTCAPILVGKLDLAGVLVVVVSVVIGPTITHQQVILSLLVFQIDQNAQRLANFNDVRHWRQLKIQISEILWV